jgi:hypothetical protein
MAQVGVYSASLLMQHDHLNASMGGILNAYSRYGAYRRPFNTGALAISCDNDAQVTDNIGADPQLMKEIRINAAQAGNFRISWRMCNVDNVSNVDAWFYVNGIVVSPIKSTTSNAWQTKTHDYNVNLALGDLLQIWGDRGLDSLNVDRFRIYYAWRIEYFGDGTVNNLITALPLSDADLLDFTAIV